MNKSFLIIIVLLAAVGAFFAFSHEELPAPEPKKQKTVQALLPTATEGWARPSSAMMGAAYGTLTNPSNEPVVIVSGKTDIAEVVEFHRVEEADGIMKMRPEEQLLLSPKETLELAPGAGHRHLMLIRLKEGLEPGQQFTIELMTDAGASVPLTVTVRDMSNTAE